MNKMAEYVGPKFDHRKTDRIIYYAKKSHRSDIRPRSWNAHGYSKSNFCEKALDTPSNIDYLSMNQITPKYFLDHYDANSIPCVIHGKLEHWLAHKNWTFDYLEKKYYRASFKVGEDDDGNKIKLQMKYFMDYLRHQEDDSPLYLFDGNAEDRSNSCSLINDWDIIDLFPFDFHAILGDSCRPPHRWFCIGPKRSGTTLHQDPLHTAAWNALIKGYKWWVLIPPHVPKKVANGQFLQNYKKYDEAILWYDKILPQLREERYEIPIYEVIQKPGDIIFVPPGWWHAVLNLSDSISCTQNFVSHANFVPAWKAMRKGRPKLATMWLNRMKNLIPSLFETAEQLNERDGWYSDGNIMKKAVKNQDEDEHSESSSSDSSSSSSESSEDEDEIAQIKSTLIKNFKRLPEPYKTLYPTDVLVKHNLMVNGKFTPKENDSNNQKIESYKHKIDTDNLSVKKARI